MSFKKGYTPWNKGKKMPEETCARMSKSRKGHVVSDETKRKLSEAMKSRDWKPKWTKESRDKLSKTLTGHSFTEESRKRLSESAKRRMTKNPPPERHSKGEKDWNERPEYIKGFISALINNEPTDCFVHP